jgi:hypothetical protein
MAVSLQRLGSFIMLIGLILLVIFFASDQSQKPEFELFFSGSLLTILGGFMILRYRPPAQPSGRFRVLRGMDRPPKSKKDKQK